tara:strand:+ start:3727 stop:3942 length:216 start_codon:yes stop_codon:yes gene_type:complete
MDWPLQNVNLSPSFIENTLQTLPKLQARDNRGQAYRPYKVKEAKKYSTTISSTAERKVPQYVKCGIGLATK